MIYKLTYIIGLLGLWLLLPACMPKLETLEEEVVLRLSEENLLVDKHGGEKVIAIESSVRQWSFVSADEGDWLSLSKQGNSLRIAVDENPHAERRRTSITIVAGGMSREIALEQTASDAVLELGTTGQEVSLDFAHVGGVGRVEFFTNSPAVEVSTAEGNDWLTIRDKDDKGFVVEVKPNAERSRRVGKVLVSTGGINREVNVVQLGTPYYVLPLIQSPLSLNQMLTQERARGSEVIQIPTDRVDQTVYRLKPQSPIVAFVEYRYQFTNQLLYNFAFVAYPDAKEVVGNEAFAKFMEESGFPLKGQDALGREVYFQSEDVSPFQAVVQPLGGGGALVIIAAGVRQNRPMPTFQKLPMEPMMSWLGQEPEYNVETGEIISPKARGTKKMGYIYDRKTRTGTYKPGGIFEWEMQQGSVFDQKLFDRDPDVQWYTFHTSGKSQDDPIRRKYFAVTPYDYEGLEEGDEHLDDIFRVIGHFADVTRAFFHSDTGNAVITEEFNKLMKDNGFRHTLEEQGWFFFYNQERNISIVLVEVDNPSGFWMDINRSHRADFSTASVAQLTDYRGYLDDLARARAYIAETKRRGLLSL